MSLVVIQALCPITGNKTPELDKLYIQENFTANGVGSALLKHALSFCHSIGHEQVWLTVFHENTRALRFYGKHDFKEVGVTYFELENEKHKNHALCKSTAV
ncbi:GNAT family N-acetyltransferase [Sinobacterium caligoides]|uniref:GNAT family N-acetyltransferase n=1 Tax=Sinobacterium caligoides TaxID=933926 RepID=UPI000F4D243C